MPVYLKQVEEVIYNVNSNSFAQVADIAKV